MTFWGMNFSILSFAGVSAFRTRGATAILAGLKRGRYWHKQVQALGADMNSKTSEIRALRKALNRKERALLRLYGGLMRVIPEWLIKTLVRKRAKTHPGEENAERAAERVARILPERPAGKVIWLQSIGPGDSTANLVLIQALREVAPGAHFLITTRTVDAQGIFKREAEKGDVTLLLAPHDFRAAMVRFLDHWRPDVAVFCESDIWPNTLSLLAVRGVPMALINGQFNGRLGRLIGKMEGLGRWMMAHLDLLHIFSDGGEELAKDWVRGDCDVMFAPNLKMDSAQLEVKEDVVAALRGVWGESPIFFGASVDEGEIETLLKAHEIAARYIVGLKTVVAPRWKEQGEAIHAICNGMGVDAARRSVDGMPTSEQAVFVADSYGEFGAWLEVCFGTFMGHTLFGGVGHNPYEPIIHRRQIVSGSIPPFLATDYQYLADIGLCCVADTPEGIAAEMVRLWQETMRGEDRFGDFSEGRGFSRDMARRIIAL